MATKQTDQNDPAATAEALARTLLLGRRYNRTKKANGQRGTEKLDQNDPASTAEVLHLHGRGVGFVGFVGSPPP